MTATITHLRVHNPRLAPESTPPMNVHAYVHSILECANSLLRNDYRIKAFFAQGEPSRATIELYDSPRLRDLVRVGQATYYEQGCDAEGPYRSGHFKRVGVDCIWKERGAA